MWYMGTNAVGIRKIHRYAALIHVFVKYNTPVPSSATVERFFSLGKDILVDNDSGLSAIGSAR
jgi:hypothetical protein